MSQIIFLNGRYLHLKLAGISPLDLGLIRGYGIFDVMKVINGKPFLIAQHWERLKKSAELLELSVKMSDRKYAQIVKTIIRKNKVRNNHIIRTVITGGLSPDGLAPAGKETFYVTVEKLKPLRVSAYTEGVKVITHDYQREYSQSKVTNYVTAIKNIKRKKKEGAHEVIYVNNGKVKEGALSNFFIVKKKKIITPKDNVLIGITRNLVMKLARKNGYPVVERDINLKELYRADEMFLTNTTKGIVPVVKIDGKKIGAGKPGICTQNLSRKFSEYLKNY